ncbi:unnamed protein product [Linum tenue]|uniref:GDSL esterase/lipase n=1 Tax=Linum tenue TaxID=586396 RepID=A0AAV0PYP3_9ROSI|nr:unnamed protein product [Linum tenue]
MAASIVKSAVHKLCWQALVLIALHHCYCHNSIAIAQEVPCCFIFGDSLVDNGNNNQLLSLARADYPPYGIDFPAGPSGRFSNGKTTADVITELLGFDNYIPPYAAAAGEDVLKGVNYASAAAGIRDDTGRHLGERISFSGQVRNHQDTVSRIVELMGTEETAAKHLSKCIYSFGLGSNDYLNNYFVPLVYTTALEFTPEEYADDLIRTYTVFVGFQVTNEACCGVGRNNGQITCLPLQAPCENRDEYLFWDAFHPTEAANRAVGRRFYKAQSPSDTYPFDIHRLAQL